MNEDTIDTLNDLIHLDRDAIRAYDQAIEACDVEEVRTKLDEFKGDHRRHVLELEEAVRAEGGAPPEGRDVKGFLIEGFTALTSHGDRSALFAMRGNEELTNRTYKNALEKPLTVAARVIVERGYDDEKRHLAWIKDMLAKRGWEGRKAA